MASAKKTEKKRGRGRPPKYNDQMIDKAYEYLDSCKDTISDSGRVKVKLPTHEGLALYLDVCVDTIYDWASKDEEFSEALKKIKLKQRERLLFNGLSGDYNSTIAKLVLSANHGMSEKSEVDHTSKGEILRPQIVINGSIN